MRIWIAFQDLKDFAHQVHFYEHDAWMGEYDVDDVGEYLEQFAQHSSGERNWFERENLWYPSRADFIKWKYHKTKGKKTETQSPN